MKQLWYKRLFQAIVHPRITLARKSLRKMYAEKPASKHTTLCWETMMFQDCPEPSFRTLYGNTFLEAVQKRGAMYHGLNPVWTEGTLEYHDIPFITVVSDRGLEEIFILNEVWAVDTAAIEEGIHLYEWSDNDELVDLD